MTLVTFIMSLIGPIAARVLSAFGLSMIVLTGLSVAADSLKSLVTSNLSGMPLAVIQLGGLFGIWTCVGLIFGAITFVITWRTTASFWALAAK